MPLCILLMLSLPTALPAASQPTSQPGSTNAQAKPLPATQPMFRKAFDLADLAANHPPRWTNPNKLLIARLVAQTGRKPKGDITVSRWQAMELPTHLDSRNPQMELAVREDWFDYQQSAAPAVDWYLNFADPNLFAGYAGGLFAQDEMQVVEHPDLASVREAMLSLKLAPRTIEACQPTPVLLKGVPRRCRVATEPNAAQGRPRGLYGVQFGRADAKAVEQAVTVMDPPTLSNIIAMASLAGGAGAYRKDEIDAILRTAFTGFAAARIESQPPDGPGAKVVIHTGFWGCGAFGGNRVMIVALQIIAARLAGIDRLVFHVGDRAGSDSVQRARTLLDAELAPSGKRVELSRLIDQLHAKGFRWGVSDGN